MHPSINMSNFTLSQGSSKGRPSMFQGTSPGVPGLGQATRVVNQTLGFQTNHTINYAYVIRRFKDDSDKSILQGQQVFIRKSHPPVGPTIYTMLNLPLMNSLLAEMSKRDSGLTVEKIDMEYAPHGVVQGEAGRNDGSRPQERLLNVTIAGRTRAFNIWGSNATDGTPLFIILKKINLEDGGYKCNLEDQNRERTNPRGDAGSIVYQFVPYANCREHYPPRKELGLDPDNSKVYYVGRVSHNSRFKTTSEKHRNAALRSIHKHATLPMLEMFVDYELAI